MSEELPALPDYPVIPQSEDRGKWNAWARAYGAECARLERERAASIVDRAFTRDDRSVNWTLAAHMLGDVLAEIAEAIRKGETP